MRRIPLTSVLFGGAGVKRAPGPGAHDPVRRHGSPSALTVEQ
jgi:2-polyprenyl-6-hydroxyphenyl methylase/3-demethylubiquinone-9 3-methyltransferase